MINPSIEKILDTFISYDDEKPIDKVILVYYDSEFFNEKYITFFNLHNIGEWSEHINLSNKISWKDISLMYLATENYYDYMKKNKPQSPVIERLSFINNLFDHETDLYKKWYEPLLREKKLERILRNV